MARIQHFLQRISERIQKVLRPAVFREVEKVRPHEPEESIGALIINFQSSASLLFALRNRL
jgi:hypothetical protein